MKAILPAIKTVQWVDIYNFVAGEGYKSINLTGLAVLEEESKTENNTPVFVQKLTFTTTQVPFLFRKSIFRLVGTDGVVYHLGNELRPLPTVEYKYRNAANPADGKIFTVTVTRKALSSIIQS